MEVSFLGIRFALQSGVGEGQGGSDLGIKVLFVNNNSPIQDYVHLDDQTQPTFESFI